MMKPNETHVHAPVVISGPPIWGRIETIYAYTGVPINKIRKLVTDGFVRCRKIDPEVKNSACVYKLSDLLEWLEQHPQENPQ